MTRKKTGSIPDAVAAMLAAANEQAAAAEGRKAAPPVDEAEASDHGARGNPLDESGPLACP